MEACETLKVEERRAKFIMEEEENYRRASQPTSQDIHTPLIDEAREEVGSQRNDELSRRILEEESSGPISLVPDTVLHATSPPSKHTLRPRDEARGLRDYTKDIERQCGDCGHEGRCSARIWRHASFLKNEGDGKGFINLGFDSIQCSSCKKVSTDDVEDIMEEFKEKMSDDQLARLPDYLENYDGCFCKNHLKKDFFMPNGWWLGKLNEDRPEKLMLPKGSFKDGYREDYKEHYWMCEGELKEIKKLFLIG